MWEDGREGVWRGLNSLLSFLASKESETGKRLGLEVTMDLRQAPEENKRWELLKRSSLADCRLSRNESPSDLCKLSPLVI